MPHLFPFLLFSLRLNITSTVVHLSIEPPKKHHPRPEEDDDLPPSSVQAIMTSKGYMLPDESVENRFAVWFTGGSLRPAEGVDLQAWSDIFGRGNDRRRKLADRAKVVAAKLLLGAEIPHGMEADGSMTYHFHRPLPGHLDVLYTDDTLQVLKGNRGSVMVHARHGEPTQGTATRSGAPRPNNGLVHPSKNGNKKGAARIA